MTFEKIVKDIKSLKIQGAENVAKSAINALRLKYKETKKKNLSKYIKVLEETRATEPCMRNALKYFEIISKKESVENSCKKIIDFFDAAEKKISLLGVEKIKNNQIIFTHCHSETVMNILKLAKKQRKNFCVYNTETRPLLQGRVTARELSKARIPVVSFVDSAARLAIKKCDLVLIGCDAISSEGYVYNKIGSEMICEIAQRYDVPVYVCTNSWKFDPLTLIGVEEKIEERKPSEVWKKSPKGVVIDNLSFEKIHPELITGIITELGVFKPTELINFVEKEYSWMFKQ